MPPLRAPALVLALALLLEPGLARACSCMILDHPTLEGCQGARRVFAGRVGEYAWPTALRASADRSVEINLDVDAVWRGEVPTRLVVETDPLGGPGSCTIYPSPGERFVVCDGREGAAEPALGFCHGPAFGEEAEALIASLGPAVAPSAPMAARVPWWRDRERLAESSLGLSLVGVPFIAALLGAGAGALLPRRQGAGGERPSRRGIVALLIAAAILMIVARLVLHRLLPPENLLFTCVTLGPSALAGLFGVIFAFRMQRRRRGPWSLVIAFVGVGVALAAGYTRLHAPVQAADAFACSEARAREYVRAYPFGRGDAEREAWARGAPASCADWGLGRMEVPGSSPVVGFADGSGGYLWVRGGEFPSQTYLWELP
ncbi:MAG: hypothetical protein H6710_19090 [Myxococcales bacterium]|nr:hypothetical protein [Myxococcales bacterium]